MAETFELMNDINKISKLVLFCIAFLAIVIGGLWVLVNAAHKFFREADRIEEMIRNNDSKENVITALYGLRKDSFHRQTGDRLHELAKMAEIKYDIQILKR